MHETTTCTKLVGQSRSLKELFRSITIMPQRHCPRWKVLGCHLCCIRCDKPLFSVAVDITSTTPQISQVHPGYGIFAAPGSKAIFILKSQLHLWWYPIVLHPFRYHQYNTTNITSTTLMWYFLYPWIYWQLHRN